MGGAEAGVGEAGGRGGRWRRSRRLGRWERDEAQSTDGAGSRAGLQEAGGHVATGPAETALGAGRVPAGGRQAM